jgi:hypothetical protein
MARAKITVTQSWQDAAIGKAVFTVVKVGEGSLLFNETASDATAHRDAGARVNSQYSQSETLPTKVRATGDGWEIIADGVLS